MQLSGIEVLFQGTTLVQLLRGLSVSVSIALAAMTASVALGVPLGLVMTSRNRAVRFITRLYLEFIRIMPQLVLLFVFYFYVTLALGIDLDGPLAAVVVFTAWGTAEMGDLVRGAVQSVPVHQLESASALGLTRRQVQRDIVLPQCVRALAPGAVNLVTRMIKTTSLVVLIGVVEVLKVGQQIIDRNRFEHPDAALWVYAAIFILYFAVCFPLTRLAKNLEKKWATT